MTGETRTTCPYCGVGCGLLARAAKGRLQSVAGDPLHPVNRGATCRKPLRLPEAVHAPDRATVPLVRPSVDAGWRRQTWRSAIAGVARRLRAVVDEHGPDAVAFYLSGQLLTEDYYAASKLVKGFLGTNNVDSNSRLCMSSAVAGHVGAFGSDGPPASYADLDVTDCVLVLGSNAAACHPIVWARVQRRRAEGAFVIVADPRRTPTADGADLHLAVRPGADLALLNGIVHVLDRDGLVDERFVARRTEGASEVLTAAREWTPDRAAAVSGVPAASIEAAARRFGEAKRATVLWSMGANQSTVGTLKNRALVNLCLLTGNLGRAGAGPLSLTGQPNAMGGRESGGLATLLPGYRDVRDPEHRAEMRRLWALPPDAAGISPTPGLPATHLVEALEEGRVRVVWIAATNPVASQPDAERFAAALRRADLVVVQDAYHPTETSALAHVVLPAAQWPEKDGVMTNSERRLSLVRRAVPPPGEALPDWRVFARLGRALGHRDAFAWPSAADVFGEFAATTAGRLCDVSGVTHERLRREGSVQWPCPAEHHPGTERLYGSGRFSTPSGRARLAVTPHAEPVDAPDDDFPLVLTTGRVADQWHTMTRTGKSPDLLRPEPEPRVDLHPDDARRAGVADGARVRVVSRRGVAHLRARLAETVPEGVAFAPMHWGALHLDAGARPVNAVVSGALDPVSAQAELKATAVRVEPVGAPPAPRRRVPRRRVLVVGGGMAGQAVAEGIAAQDPEGFAVTIAAGEPELPYDRVRLAHALAGEVPAGRLQLRDRSWFDVRGIAVRTGSRVTALDLPGRRARLEDGTRLEWDRLVLATGSVPAVPPIAGVGRDGVHVFRTLADVRRLLDAAVSARRAVVIGGGLLGLEAARGLQVRGLAVTVVHLADRLMEQQLDGPAAGILERRLRGLGIDVRVGASTREVMGGPRATGVRLADGQQLEADVVVLATGIRPDTALAAAAGLEVARGVVVDDELRTSAPGVWAVGECAEHRGVVYGLWAPVRRQAETAAAVLAGRPAAFHGAVPATTLKVMGVDLFCAGRAAAGEGEDEVLALDTRRGSYRKLVLRDDRVMGAILLGDLRDAGRLHGLVGRGAPAPPDLLEAGSAPAAAAAEVVCTCMAVTAATIREAVTAGGLERVEQVARATGATTGCGGCRADVEGLIRAARPVEAVAEGRPLARGTANRIA